MNSNQLFSYWIWSQTGNEWTHPFGWEFFFLYWLNISQPNIVMDAGIHASLHANCDCQIVYAAKFDLKNQYAPPY